MKRIVTLLILISRVAFGQEESVEYPSRTVFKLSPFHFTQNTLKVGIEAFSEDRTKSLNIYAGVRTSTENTSDLYTTDRGYDGVLGELQYKKYVSPLKEYTSRKNRTYVQGIYAGVFVQGGAYSGNRHYVEYNFDPVTQVATNVEYRYKEDAWNAAIGFTLGAQRVFWNLLFVDVYIGGGLQIADGTKTGPVPQGNPYYYYHNTSYDPPYEGIIPKIGIQIGMGL